MADALGGDSIVAWVGAKARTLHRQGVRPLPSHNTISQPPRMWANNWVKIHLAVIGNSALDYKKSISRKRSLFCESPTNFAVICFPPGPATGGGQRPNDETLGVPAQTIAEPSHVRSVRPRSRATVS